MEDKMKNLLIFGIIVGLLFVSGCSSNTDNEVLSQYLSSSSTQELKQFKDLNELKDYLELHQSSNNYDFNIKTLSARSDTMAVSESAAPNSDGSDGSYSSTNVQVQGVDEADFVKNDDRYIYLIADGKLIIVDTKDNIESEIVSETTLNLRSDNADTYDYYSTPNVRDIFLYDNTAVVFMDSYEKELYFDRYNIKPYESYKQNTKVLVFDVSNREDPVVEETFTISGYYYSSRLIKDKVYVITQESLYGFANYPGPMVKYSDKIMNPEIYYFDNPENNYQLSIITSIDITKNAVVDTKSFMLGYTNTLMVSENNIYISYQKQNYWCLGWRCMNYDNDAKGRFTEVVVPLLEGDLKDNVEDILSQDLEEDEEWSLISKEFAKFYEGLQDDKELQKKYEDMFSDIEDALNEYDAKKAMDNSKTIIHKIAINDGNIEYKTKGEVDGYLLNQFSMDEHDGNLRVATTINFWLNSGNIQYNNVYILDEDMNVVGSLENLAKNESIYSSRFIGDKLYLVTFRQIDPFFVIDLSDAENPKVLGYLKIPGYSSYLHPIGEDQILGIGKDVGENEWGGTSAKGLKVTLFDISDFENLKEIDTKIIGIEGSDSPALYDHKAFTYLPDKKIVILPVNEVEERIKSGTYSYRTKVWNGAYVLSVDDEVKSLGRIEHSSSESEYYYWFNTASVSRSIYIKDFIYTLSTKYLKINSLEDLDNEATIKLPYVEPNYGYLEPMPVDTVAVME
jgi:uncharacterized secreted protein with C-terminal beta-propeller domain